MNRATKCWSCGNWDKCYKYLYGNKKQEYMKKIDKIKDSYGETIIRVWQCENFEKVANDIPIYITKRIKNKSLRNSENVRILILRDILNTEE